MEGERADGMCMSSHVHVLWLRLRVSCYRSPLLADLYAIIPGLFPSTPWISSAVPTTPPSFVGVLLSIFFFFFFFSTRLHSFLLPSLPHSLYGGNYLLPTHFVGVSLAACANAGQGTISSIRHSPSLSPFLPLLFLLCVAAILGMMP